MFAFPSDLRRLSRGSAIRLRSADNVSEFRVVVVVVGGATVAAAGGLYFLFGGLWWAGAIVVPLTMPLAAALWDRASLLVDHDRMVPVVAGRRGDAIWWDTVDSMYVDRRQPPSTAGGAIDALGNQPAHVVVVRLKTGDEIPLWVVAANGGRVSNTDPEGRIDAILAQLEAAHRPSQVRQPSTASGRQERMRPVDYGSNVRLGTFLVAVLVGVLVWLVGWSVAVVVAVLAITLIYRVAGSRYLLVDGERIVPVIAGVRRRSIWWDTVDAMYVDRRRPPKGIGPTDDEAAPDELPHVIVVRLDTGEEVPLWAMAPFDGSGDGDAQTKRRTDALLEQLEFARRPPTLLAPTGIAGRPIRLRPVNSANDFRFSLVMTVVLLTPVVLGAVYWVLPWWVGGIVLVFCAAFGWERGRYLLVDRERIVPVVGGIRERSIWWATVAELSVGRRTPPKGLGIDDADADANRGAQVHVIVARLTSGDEIPLWAVSGFDDARAPEDKLRRIEALLERLEALRPTE